MAYRELASVFDFFFRWIAPPCGHAWGEQAREVAITESWVWVRRRDRSVWRVPRSTLRDVHRFADGQVLITFGRRTQLWLHDRPGCAVVGMLCAQGASHT